MTSLKRDLESLFEKLRESFFNDDIKLSISFCFKLKIDETSVI